MRDTRLGVVGRVLVLELRDHAPCRRRNSRTRALTRHRENRPAQAGAHQRPHQGQEAGGIAAGIGHAAWPRRSWRRWPRSSSGEAIGPAIGDAVGGGGVDHPGGGIVDQGHGLARRFVRQAQDHHVGGVQRRACGRPDPCARHRPGPISDSPARPASRSRISSPVVPAAPSMKTCGHYCFSFVTAIAPLEGEAASRAIATKQKGPGVSAEGPLTPYGEKIYSSVVSSGLRLSSVRAIWRSAIRADLPRRSRR